MKALVCEMCNSNDVVKSEGYFVCQSCGTKYSVEEAKKMMIDGVVDVSGSTIKVDSVGNVGNYLKLAKNAYDSRNLKEAEDYCNRIIEIEPEHYEAWMLKGKVAGESSTIRNIRFKESVNCFVKAIESAPDDCKEVYKQEASDEFTQLSKALIRTGLNNFVNNTSYDTARNVTDIVGLINNYGGMLFEKCGVKADGFWEEVAEYCSVAAVAEWNFATKDFESSHQSKYVWERTVERADYALAILKLSIELSDKDKDKDINRYKHSITIQNAVIRASNGNSDRFPLSNRQRREQDIRNWHNEIKKLDPSYEIPAPAPANNKSGGCYVATAVYGSYDCPQVWTLRRYRDYTLAETWYGRAFIRTYYAISPTLVKWFGHTEWFKHMWRGRLDRMVYKLNSEGVDDTPYIDREW